MKNIKNILYSTGAFLITYGADQGSKILAVHTLQHRDIVLLPFLKLSLAYNYGVGFSLLQQLNPVVLSLLTLCITIGITAILWKEIDKKYQWGIGIFVASALGNITNRLYYGYVIDFIDVHVGSYHWPTFNIADSCLSIIMVVIVYSALVKNKRTPHKK